MQEGSLSALLSLLGDGPESSGTAYGNLHQRLTRYFRINACADPEQLADEVLNRLAKIAASDAASIASPTAFALGIARHVLQENVRAELREAEAGRNWQTSRKIANPDEEVALQAIDVCLASMPTAKSELLRTYYESTGKQKIEHHRQLAERLGISINTLRNRLMRARRELDTCVRNRLSDVSSQNRT
ncbi:RNA polymerase sigma factor [Terriglobus roseus]|uniref:DNA-directed RNA polymerase specialized sigma subunit, sigma24 family n=1 Tax=Terriglobus roseus TaxID=392734 RepID=A0A1G7GB37_9BACT|nr:hypothetical protein [Terriglobus roseus]SDE85336.1 DNA-directed RNA polymerase specialized sigma subunit, sigma24 family [Terriglobus roseus]